MDIPGQPVTNATHAGAGLWEPVPLPPQPLPKC